MKISYCDETLFGWHTIAGKFPHNVILYTTHKSCDLRDDLMQ